LVIFSQARIKIAAAIKVANIVKLNTFFSVKATALPTQMGMMATLYIGGLIAAIHNLLLGRVICFVVISLGKDLKLKLNTILQSNFNDFGLT
jgi:hypothetical protein